MAIDRTKLQKMHKLMADNGYTQDYNTFEKKFTGDSNYANRKAVYDLFTQNGADLGGSYEEFMRKLQKPRATKPQQQPKTALGRAQQSVAQQKWGGYGGTVTPMQDDSELVRGLKNADAAQRLQAPVSYAKPGAVKQMVKQTRERQHVAGQNVEQAGRQFTNRERDRRNAPAFDLGNEDVNNSLVKTRGQLEDEVEKSANNIVAQSNGIGGMLDNTIGDVFGKVDKEAIDAFRNTQAGGFDDLGSSALANLYKRIDPEKVFKELNTNVEKNISQWLTNPSVISQIDNAINESGISKEAYVNNILVPQIMKRMNEKFDQTELSRNMDKGMAQYYLNGLGSNLTGTLMDILLKTKGTREYEARASAMTEEGLNPDVNPNMADRVIRQTVGFFGDTSVFGPLGKAGAAVTGKIFGNGVAQTARIANSTLGGRIARMAGSGMVSQGVTGVLYGSTNAAVQNYSTGDDTSIGNTVKLMAMGGLSEGASWATMGGIGGAVGAGIYNVSGVKRIPAKAFQLAMEGIGMHMGGNVAKTIEGHDTDWLSVEGNLEACANVVALKLTHARLPKRQEKDGVKESYLDVVARNIKSLMTSDGQRAAFGGYTFTNEEKEQLFGSASAPKRNESIYGYDVHDNPLTRKESLTSWAMRAKKTAAKGKGEKDTDAEFVKTAYDEIMADNTIPWDTKAKFSALVMGTVPSERPMMENCRIEGGSVNEYSKNGELLSKNIFKSIDERNSIIYSLNMKREDQRLSNAYGAAQIKDEKTAQATLEAVAEANGMTAEQLKTAMDKQPLRRSEEEQNACVALRKAYEDEQFVPGTLHAEQSNTEGKDVVEENNLGTENPNNEAVAKVLGDLTKAEDALQAAMDGNDVLKEEYERMQKAGMSNPQIYMELFNSGLTQEQLAPLADYINALSKEQGMFKGTQDKIVETTQKHVGQWSYKGELNGEKQNGEQMVFVKDNKGRVLIVGAGDVAFDNDGRARESVGDMLSVLDPTTMEMDFVSKKDVQLDHVEKTEDYAKNYQTMLEVKNSEVYAQNEQQKQMEKKPENLPKGRKQVVRSLSLLDKVSSPKDKLNEIRRIEQNVELGEKGAITPEEQAHVDEVLAELKEQGYEMDNEGIVGSEFRNNGRNDIIVDNASVIEPGDPRYDKLEDGQTVIDKIIKPKILKDGKIYQPATVTIMFRADTSVSERLYEAKRELAGMLKADESNEIVQRKIAETKAEIAELEKKKAEELASKPQQNPTNAGYEIAKTLKEKIGGSLSEEEATNLVGEMESRAEEAHDMPLTPENWEAEFGEDGKVQTPLGEVKMGKNQLVKLFERGRSKEFGMIKPTLSDPDVVIEVPSEAKDGKAERDTSLLFIKTFKKPNGEKVYYFKSVTIKKDGIEISISSHYDRRKRVEEALKNGKLLYLKQGDAQTEQSQLPVSGTTFREIIAGLNGKDSNNSANGNGNNETLTFADGSPVPMKKDSKNRDTADYSQMTPEQGAEWMASQFGENAEAAVDGQIKRAEKTLKDAEKIKVDYTGDLNDAKEAEAQKKIAIEAAKAELELYTNIKKAMTEKKVKAGMEKVSSVGGVGEVGSVGSVGVAREKFESGLRVVGNKRTRTLADGSKLRGHYEIVDADSLTPSHNANDGYKKSEGFPVNEEGRTINDRDYENDKQAQLVTDMIAMKYDGQAVDQVPVVTSDGIVVDGNGRTMAGQKAAKNGTDSAYLEALKENAENYGFTAEQIEQSGIKHPRLVLVSDEPMKYDTATFAKFNKNEKKAQGNTQQAVANSKKLSTDEIGTIISEIDGSGSLDAFFNNPSAINSLLTRLVDKGVIGLNEVAGLREGEDKLSAAGKDFVKNLLLGSVFSENTIRMMGADAMLKTKALNGIRAVTDNMKLGDYALMKEIDKAVQLLYEARQGGSGVDAYLRTPAMFGENAADRYDPISQAIALALEGKVEDFRELMMAYNRNAAPYADANQTEMFGERPTNEEFIKEFLKLRNWEDYETRHSSKEGNGDAGSSEGTEPQARGGSVVTSEADYNKAVERLREAKGEERERILDQMGEYVKEFAKSNGYDEPVVLRTKKDLVDAAKNPEEKSFIENMQEGEHYPGYYENGKIHIYLEGSTGSKELRETFIHESVHADNDTDPSRVESLVYSITDMNTLTRRDLESVIEKLVHATHYTDEARKLPEDEALHMLADEALAHLVEYAQRNGIRAISEITNNPTLLNVAEKAFKERENDRRRKEGLDSRGDTEQGKNIDVIPAKKDSGTHVKNTEGESGNIGLGSTDKGSRNNEGQRDVDKVEEGKSDKPYEASLSLTEPGEPTEPKGEEVAILPKKEDNTFNPIVKAAENYKKDHPLTEGEIRSSDVDDIAKDMAVDYLNGEVTDDLHRAVYESIYGKVKDAKMKNAAEKFAKEKEAATEAMGEVQKPQQKADDAAVEASNKKVNDLWNDLLKAGREDLSASFIGLNARQLEVLPKLVSAMAENAYLRIKRGMHNLEDVVKEMRKEFAPAAQVFKKEDVDAIYEQMMNIRYRDGEQRMSLKEWADYYEKSSPKHKEELVGDSKEAEDRKISEKKFIDKVNHRLGFGQKINGIVELRKMAEECGLKDVKDTDLQELAETAIVRRARGIASSASTNDAKKFELIKKLYENQPSLNQRDSERVMKQQYSTPAPYAFLADMYVKAGMEVKSALEPSAGNGMLTIGLPKDAVHVNDIDAQRLANLQRQGFKNITSQDGTQPFADKDVDVVVTNPPFGSATPKEYDGYKISSLEGQMAINALESMKDNGRAAIIIGGKTEYAKNGSLTPKDKALLGYLYSHYNVEDVINVDGSLYAKQGTTYPTRIILINGRRYDENAYPPVKDKARAEAVKSYDELYKRINDDILRSGRMDSPVGEGGEKVNAEPDKQGAAGAHEEGLRMGQSRGGKRKATDGSGGIFDEPSVRVPDDELGNGRRTGREPDGELHNGDSGADTTGTEPTQSEGRGNNSNRHGVGGSLRQPGNAGRTNTEHINNGPSTVLKPKPAQERSLSTEKVGYAPKSENPFTLQSVMPADQQEAVNKNLEKLGDADQFLVDELGYNDKDDLYSHLAAEQVDSVALAIQQAKKGNAFIIGDMTGIGKGRQAASLIRYAKKQGQVPVYFTKTAGLLSDVYRDLVDIGSPELRPFVFGSSDEAKITDSDGKVVYKLPTKEEKERVIDYIEKNGKLPEEYDYVLTTYSQVGNGVYEFDENDNRKERKLKKGDKFGPSHFSGQARRDAIEKLISNGYLILDESHTAGGQSNQGNYFQHIIQKAKNVTFFSATFAKRPDNMPIYALRTAMNEGGMKASDLIDAVKRGGATLQEIMSQTLTQCGQMIRRERDMTGVTIDWKPIDDPVVVSEQREQYDKTIELFNDIINFQKNYVMPYIDERNEELAAIQATIGLKKGTKALGIASTPFASKAFNTVQQVLLSLKAKEAAKRAIDYLKQGVKPVIALNNTNESQSGEIKENEEVEEPDLGTSLKKGLAGTLRYTKKDSKNNADSGTIDLASLGDEAVNAYNQLMTKIEHASTGLALSPIDVIKNELQKAGYKVGELTGRKTQFIYNDNGSVSKVKRTDTDKKKLAREFNDGSLDALILNKSASTGISLHASSKFNDQRKRVMIVAQQQLDVNDEVQMRGRIDRTGQVQRGAYEYIVSQIPAEQRLLMMFKAKLKSLDANTTSSQKSKFNEMEVADITNKYGDRIVKEYMAEHLDLYSRMADPFGWEKNGADLYNIDSQKLINSSGGKDYEDGQAASKLLGRMALLRVNEQEKMLQEIGDLYAAEIQRLNEMGENDLEITELPLKAKTINKGIWKEGSEPGGDNAFADNTYVEKVNMAVLKKPMKAEEVKKAQDGLTGNRSWDEYRKEKITAAKEYFDNKITEATEKYEERAVKTATKAKEKYIKDAKKAQKDTGMSDEQIEKMAGYQYDSVYGDEKTKLDEVVKNLKSKYGVFERALETFNTDDAFVLPTDMNNPAELSGFGNSYGRLIDIKITDNFSPNASTVSFATLDGRRKITFPINGKVGIGSDKADVIGIIDRLTRQASAMGDKHLRVLSMDASNWDKLTSNESRKDGYIITGNLLQALIDTKEQGLGGQLVKYTTDTGEVKTGILMPEKFEPKGLANDKPINSVAEKFELPSNKGGITEITSSDGDVKIEQGFDYMKMARNYTIRVPKSNKKGGKYFLDKELLKMVDGGNFETRGNTMLAEVKADKLKDVLDRLSELGVKVREESEVHYRTDASLSLSKPLEGRIAETVEKVSKQTGGKVKMVNSVEEIGNEQVRRDIESGKKVTGWYDENTGEVHLYMPNIHDAYTAEKTVWHETVGHKGMRGLLGDKFNDYMRGLWLDLDNPVNAELRAYVKERMGKDSMGFYDAIEEFIAESAEKGKGEPGFWNYIKNKVTDALHEIGYRISPNVKDVKYMLWLAKNVQKKGNDPWWKMRADAVKWKIEHENVEYTKIHGGEFYENDGKSHDFEDMSREEWDEATDGQIHYRTAPSAATALDRYHKMLDAHGYMATEAFMDNMLSLDKLMRAVDPSIKKIEDVKSSMNPYILQNTMQGAMSDKMTLFEHQVMKPLDKAMSDVLDSFAGKNTEEKIRECNLYMIGKHGLERNRVLFVRDKIREERRVKSEESNSIDALEAAWNGERSDLRQKLNSGQIDLREYYRQMDEWIVQNIDKDFKAEEHDYSGMHGLQEIDDLKSPYDDAGAIDSVMSQEAKMESLKKGSVDNLWKRIKDATNYSIDSDYKNGLMSEELQDHVKNMFDWYVPLRKYDEATAEDIYGYISGDNGKGFIGETLMNAKGRKSLSDVNVLAQIGAMGNRAIRNGGQNAVKQAFARFVRNSGEQNLVKETKVWVEKKGTDVNGNDIWEEAYPQIPENASAHDIATIVDAFETDMKTKQAKGEAKTLSNSTDIGFKFARAKNKSEHFVDVKIAGRTHRFVVMGNPRAAQALNGMLENSSPNSALLKGLKSTTRFMAQMATSYSPEFVMRNIIRDAEFASSNVTAKEGVMYGKKWLRYYAELNPLNVAYNEGAGALKSLKWKDLKEGVGMGLYARYREGTLGDSKMERYFKEFMQNGGETGWVQVKTMQEWEKDYKRDVSRERSKVAKTGKALRDFFVGNVENLNEVAENMARFATFCTSRDLGRSAVRSAYDAKQVSTNFNRHGSGDAIKTFKNGEMGASKEMRRNVYGTIASYLKNYSMFFNAGVQSTHLLMSNVKKAPVGTVASMMAMPFGLGIMAAVLNNAMIASEDEKKRKGVKDPYGELPEYIRRNNLCIYKGGGEFVTIPLAIELRAFYGLGDIAAGMTAAKNVKSTRNVAMDAVGCMSQLLPVVDFMNSATFDKEPGKETLKGVLPTAAAPFVEWWLNSDWKGAPIRREGDYTKNRPAWMNAYSGTPEKLMDLNKWVNAKTNDVAPGNENMRGNSLLDEATDPAMLNHIIGTLGGGAATFITRGTGLVLKYADGREQEIETKDIPFLRSLMYTPSEQTSMARTKAKWYGYKESMEKSTSNYSMLKNKNVPLTERIRNAADRHRFEQSADYARIRIIKDAEKQMKRWNKMKRLNADDKKQVDFANKNIEMIMQKAVEQMDRISDD